MVIHDRYPRLVAYSRWTVSTDSRCVSRIVDAVSECAVVRCLLRGEQNQPLIDDHDDEGILEEIREGLSGDFLEHSRIKHRRASWTNFQRNAWRKFQKNP